MWGWLGTDAVTANNIYARFLPKNSYSVSTEEGGGRTTAPTSAGTEIENSRDSPEKVDLNILKTKTSLTGAQF